MALYVVSTKVTRERFESDGPEQESKSGESDGSGKDDDSKSEPAKPVTPTSPASLVVARPMSTGGAASAGLADPKESERIDGLVFKSYLDTFGVPPTPAVSKHYADAVLSEKLTDDGLRARIEDDAKNAVVKAAANSVAPGGAAPGTGASTATAVDPGMLALREKAASLSTMTGPVSAPDTTGDATAAGGVPTQLASKLREIAGQVSSLARQYDVPLLGGLASNAPKGVESFINLSR